MRIGKKSYFHNQPVTLSSSVILTVVKSGFIDGGANVCLKNFSEIDGTIRKDKHFHNPFQRVYADNAFRPTSLKRFSVVLVECNYKLYWFAQVLFLLLIGTMGVNDKRQEFASVKYIEITPQLDKVDEVLSCIYLKWASDHETDHFYHFDSSQCDRKKAVKSFALVHFSSIRSVHHVVSSNYFIPRFSKKLPRSVYRFYVNRFHTLQLHTQMYYILTVRNAAPQIDGRADGFETSHYINSNTQNLKP